MHTYRCLEKSEKRFFSPRFHLAKTVVKFACNRLTKITMIYVTYDNCDTFFRCAVDSIQEVLLDASQIFQIAIHHLTERMF